MLSTSLGAQGQPTELNCSWSRGIAQEPKWRSAGAYSRVDHRLKRKTFCTPDLTAKLQDASIVTPTAHEQQNKTIRHIKQSFLLTQLASLPGHTAANGIASSRNQQGQPVKQAPGDARKKRQDQVGLALGPLLLLLLVVVVPL
ncbi:hypothetical protein HJFPF1_07045 [Paramyrothecium foliicola]|nr:hypothetical protein HJFPF1_07045 [Paramyrothecium foliicola]